MGRVLMILHVRLDPARRAIGPVHKHDNHSTSGQGKAGVIGAGSNGPDAVSSVLGDVDEVDAVLPGQGHDPVVAPLVAVVHQDDLELVFR